MASSDVLLFQWPLRHRQVRKRSECSKSLFEGLQNVKNFYVSLVPPGPLMSIGAANPKAVFGRIWDFNEPGH
jgi:hypothetical protein